MGQERGYFSVPLTAQSVIAPLFSTSTGAAFTSTADDTSPLPVVSLGAHLLTVVASEVSVMNPVSLVWAPETRFEVLLFDTVHVESSAIVTSSVCLGELVISHTVTLKGWDAEQPRQQV